MNDVPKIRVLSYGSGRSTTEGGIVTVGGLTEQESDILRASLLGGHHWVRRDEDGQLEHVPSYEELPGPVTDDSMLPFWRRPTEGETRQVNLFGFDEGAEAALRHASPSIYITGLCAYHYSAENYKLRAKQLTEWGFVCMRSPRDPDSGHYHEAWFLPGVWAIKGKLKEAVADSRPGSSAEKLKSILQFLQLNASFGSLDVSVQRMAAVLD